MYQLLRGRLPTLKKIHGHQYELTYWIHDNPYIFVFSTRRGPCPFEKIFLREECDGVWYASDDITDEIRPYLGPSYDFHAMGDSLCPRDLGFNETIVFRLYGGCDSEKEIHVEPSETFEHLMERLRTPPSNG